MAEKKSAYEDSTTTTIQQQQQQQKNQSHIKKVLNNINNKFSTSSSSSSPPKMNTTVTNNNNNNNSNSGTTKTHALKNSSGITNSGQQNRSNLSDNKHHHHHHHHHHHNHHNNPYVIHKTTSESIRLSTDLLNSGNNSSNNLSSSSSSSSSNLNMSGTGNMTVHQLHLSTAPLAAAAAAAIRKPKASSFQITSVTVGNKLSADNGEDSADDLDESHTDDNSRVTDLENETPSVSEDTFSKEDVFFSSNALGTAPVIPTSSQYGLVIVDPELGGVGCTSGQNLQNVHVSVMDAGINIVGPAGCSKLGDDQKELQHRNERFKVVKIESTEPFKRGRWVCMDYLDHTTLQQRNNENTNNNENLNHTGDDSNGDDGGGGGNGGAGGGTSETALTNDSGVNVSENHVDSVGGESSDTPQQISYHNSPGQTMQHPISAISSNLNSSGAGSSIGPNDIMNGMSNQIGSIHGQNLTNVVASQPTIMMPATSGNINAIGTLQQQQIPPVINDVILPPLNTETTNYVPGQSQPQIYINPQHQQQNTVQQVHGATLPANMQIQNGVPNLTSTQHQQQQQQQQHHQQQSQSSLPQVISSINVSMPVVVPSSNNNITNVEAAHNVNMSSGQPIIMQQTTQHSQAINQQTVQNQQPPQEIFQSSAPQSYSGNPITTNLINSGVIQQDIQQIDNQQQQLNITNQALQSGIVSPSSVGNMNTNVDTIQHQTNNIVAGQSLPNVKIPDMSVPQTSAPATINEAAVIISNSIQAQQQTHGQSQQSAGSEDNQQTQPMEADSESASGASAVAIDNKIEQAMDLVKSHLMIAVREEVEVLKEKIAELMDRINQLEVENTILKANVSQETLTQLQLQGSVQTVQTTTTATTNTTSTAPTTTVVTNTSNGLVP